MNSTVRAIAIPLAFIVAFVLFWEWLVWVNGLAELQNGLAQRPLARLLEV